MGRKKEIYRDVRFFHGVLQLKKLWTEFDEGFEYVWGQEGTINFSK